MRDGERALKCGPAGDLLVDESLGALPGDIGVEPLLHVGAGLGVPIVGEGDSGPGAFAGRERANVELEGADRAVGRGRGTVEIGQIRRAAAVDDAEDVARGRRRRAGEAVVRGLPEGARHHHPGEGLLEEIGFPAASIEAHGLPVLADVLGLQVGDGAVATEPEVEVVEAEGGDPGIGVAPVFSR